MGKSDYTPIVVKKIAEAGLSEPVREYRFAPPRRWKFDLAWPGQKVAFEIEGISFRGKSRHRTPTGFIGDCEKYSTAATMGWLVYRSPTVWFDPGSKFWRADEVVADLEHLLTHALPIDERPSSPTGEQGILL